MTYVTILNILIYICLLIFSIIFLFIVDDFCFCLFTQWFLIYLIGCVYKFFDLHLGFFYVKKRVEKFYMFKFLSCISVFNLILFLMIFYFFS
jgi:hypothetical protein